MKKHIRLTAFFLAALISLTFIAACSGGSPRVLRITDENNANPIFITEDELNFLLALHKAVIFISTVYNSDEFFGTITDVPAHWFAPHNPDDPGGLTNAQFYAENALLFIEYYLVAKMLCEKYDIVVSEEQEQELHRLLYEFLESFFGGSVRIFDAELSAFGINFNMFEQLAFTSQRISNLLEHLYSPDGGIFLDQLQRIYNEQYARVSIILVNNDITRDPGIFDIMDSREYEDGQFIGLGETVFTVEYNDAGEAVISEERIITRMTEEEFDEFIEDYVENFESAARVRAEEILLRTKTEDFADLLILSDDPRSASMPDGIPIRNFNSIADDHVWDEEERIFISEIFKIEIGETRIIENPYGIHIVKRYALNPEHALHPSINHFLQYTHKFEYFEIYRGLIDRKTYSMPAISYADIPHSFIFDFPGNNIPIHVFILEIIAIIYSVIDGTAR